jgi:hypothetical protein
MTTKSSHLRLVPEPVPSEPQPDRTTYERLVAGELSLDERLTPMPETFEEAESALLSYMAHLLESCRIGLDVTWAVRYFDEAADAYKSACWDRINEGFTEDELAEMEADD